VTLEEALAAETAAQRDYRKALGKLARFDAKRLEFVASHEQAARALADAKRKVAELMSGGA
jgi:hypothetical protein